MVAVPGYWMHETRGVLKPAVVAYFAGDDPMRQEDIAALRAYFRQWINADGWMPTTALQELRVSVNDIPDRADITRWLDAAESEGIDPL